MSPDIGDALQSGIDDLTTETGALVGAVYLLYSLVALVVGESLAAELLALVFESGVYSAEERAAIESFGGGTPFDLGLGLPVVVVLMVLVTLVGELVRFWAIRSFAGPSETTSSAGERAPMAVVLGGTVALALVLFQSVLPVVSQLAGTTATLVGSFVGPIGGLVLVTVFVYLRQEIALNDGGYGETVRNSFARFMDDPASIIALLLILGITGVVAGLPNILLGFLGGSVAVGGVSGTVIGRLLSTVLGAVVQTLGIAVVTDAYLQVRASARESAA